MVFNLGAALYFITTVNFGRVSSPLKETPHPTAVTLPNFQCPKALGTTNVLPVEITRWEGVCIDFLHLGISCKWNYTLCGLLILTYLT